MLVSSPCRNVLKKMGFEQTEPALQRVRGDVDWAGQTHSQQEPNGQEVIKKPFNIQRTARWNFCRKENSPRNLFKEENAQEFTKKTIQDKDSNIVRLDSVLPVQTLRNFPIEKLYGEVVMVRLDSGLLLNLRDSDDLSLNRALLTINYLYNAGAKVILVSNWLQSNASRLLSKEAFADHLSALLKVKVVPANDASAIMQFKMKNVENADVLLLDNLTNDKEEVANSYEFSKTLSSGVSIFVNDAFSLSHRVLASTVGVARFCHASVAGFHFEEELLQLMKISWMPVDLGPVSMKETSSMLSTCKVFLQSDIETVTTRMKHLFITYGKGKLVVDGDARDWMEENPFGVRTDWEQHVIERGAPMYRIVLKKV
ncbi:phosphoglycerate kinase [Musa troglodytarum]|uniref:Phosphoglycerate kinase n=1 Tax=Musa troglodytarum TaxID=320322 RepID=A0A9E7HHX8_9LILI|nr:phosphoglycerate kinase [Musa troglodytarum]